MVKLVENSKDFINRLKAGEVSGKEIRERLYVATLYVLAVAYVLGGLVAKAVVTHGPTVLHYLKKTLSTLADYVPEVAAAQPQNKT
jgi:protein involved in ribonucleotide reduction